MKLSKNEAMGSRDFLMGIVNLIEKKIQRRLIEDEEDMIIKCIKNINDITFRTYQIYKITEIVSTAVINEIHLNHCETDMVDIHELLRKNLGQTTATVDDECSDEEGKKEEECENVDVKTFFGVKDIHTLVKKINEPISSVNTTYLVLDTRYRSLENDGTQFFKWTHINNIITAQGTCNSIGNIRDIISIKLMPYTIPEILADKSPSLKISTLVHELCAQSYIAHDRRFHFMGDITRIFDNTTIKRVKHDDYANTEYKFNKPITHIDTITLSLGDPIEPLRTFEDRMAGVITPGNPTTFTFSSEHNLIDSRVYLSDFATLSPTNDEEIIQSINIINGIDATVSSATEITIPVNTSNLVQFMIGTVTTPVLLLAGTLSLTTNSTVVNGVGTNFTTDFVIGDYILINYNGKIYTYQINQITSNVKLSIASAFTGPTNSYSYKKTNNTIVGIGTQFTNICDNDIISIFDGIDVQYKINKIISDTELLLDVPFIGNEGTFTYEKNNLTNENYIVFFGLFRIVFTMELTFLSS